MKITTYTCDRCGESDQDNKIGLEKVGVFVGKYQHYGKNCEYIQEWCQKCLLRTGLQTERNSGPTSITDKILPPPTLEDLVREIVREEVNSESY